MLKSSDVEKNSSLQTCQSLERSSCRRWRTDEFILLFFFNPRYIWSRERWKIKKMDIQIGVWSSVCAVSGRQTVVQKDSIVALYQHRDPLIQEAGLPSLARVRSDPPSQVIKENAGWCIENAQGLYRNRLKEVSGTKVNILLLFAGGCHLCWCTCLRSSSIVLLLLLLFF